MFDWILMRVQPVHPEDGVVDRLASLRIRHLHLHQKNRQIFNLDRKIVFAVKKMLRIRIDLGVAFFDPETAWAISLH
jgi:hypothetical protein